MKQIVTGSILIMSPLMLLRCDSERGPQKDVRKPNLLIAIADDISWPHMSAYGCTFVNTPGFDRVAEEGILFTNCYTPNAKSSPSRACFLTGRNSWQLEEAGNHVPFFPLKFRSFIEVLGENGYFAGYTGKSWAPGVALDAEGKHRQLTGKPFNQAKTSAPAKGMSNNDYYANFEEFFSGREKGRSFCFWYGSHEPHRRYEYGSAVKKGGKTTSDIDNVFEFWPDNDTVRNDILDYAFEIEYFDLHLQKMLSLLEREGELDNTIVIVTADNGMPFPRVKGNAYEYSNHMPLAIMWKKGIRNPGRQVTDYVSFIDFAPTLMRMAGLDSEMEGMQPVQGKSLEKIFRSRKEGMVDNTRDHVLIGHERHDVGRPDDAGYPVRGIIKDKYLYLKNFKIDRWPAGDPVTGYLNTDGSPTKSIILDMNRKGKGELLWQLNFGKREAEELYRIDDDPECLKDLSSHPGHLAMKEKLEIQLLNELKEQGDPRVSGQGDVFDRYLYAEKKTRDFYNRYMKGEISRKAAGWVDSTDFEDME